MSDDMNNPSSALPEDTEEFPLSPQEQETLQQSLNALPTPKPSSSFNLRLLASLTDGRDFSPWPRQVMVRLRWMLLPAALGSLALLTFGRWSPRVRESSPPPPTTSFFTELNGAALKEPALPPLPTQIIPTTPQTLPKEWQPSR